MISPDKLIREDYQKLISQLSEFEKTHYELNLIESKQQFYLAKRDEFNQKNGEFSPVNKTALMIFLNKTYFNGLYRVRSAIAC